MIHKAPPPTRYPPEDIQILLSTVMSYPAPAYINEGWWAGSLVSLDGVEVIRKRFEQWCQTQPAIQIPIQLLRELHDPKETPHIIDTQS